MAEDEEKEMEEMEKLLDVEEREESIRQREEAIKEREEAIRELLTLCAEQNVNVPVKMRAAIFGMDITEAQQHHKDQQTCMEHAIEQRASQMAEMKEDELFQEIRRIWTSLKASAPIIDCRIKNGSYTVCIPEPQEEEELPGFSFHSRGSSHRQQQEEGGGDDEEEQASSTANSSKHRAKQRIPTVKNSSPLYILGQLCKKMVRTRSCDVRPKMVEKVIIDGVNLRFESGKIYLVLGAPGCGKSTLLKLIADTLRRDKNNVVGGEVNINGVEPTYKDVNWQNLTAYIDQIDRLHKYLTVLETCTFAWQCRWGGTHRQPMFDMDDPEVVKLVEEMDKELFMVHTVLKGMGLARVNDTFVGDNVSVRGVSGGEKKRVTVSEMLCVGVPVLCCDEISTGLDAATTYDIVKLIGATSRLTRTIRIVSLLQPPPETVALFDELILLDSGRVIYSGPVDDVVPYFETLGYKIPERMDTADWLQALPTKDGAQYLVQEDGEEKKRHLSTEEFVEKFESSEIGQSLKDSMEGTMEEDPVVLELSENRFANSSWRSLKLLIQREMLLWWRDKYNIIARIMQDLIMGIVAGTLFWQQNENPGSVMGILFQSMFFIALGAMQRVPEQFDLRGILYKQQDASFFPTWTFVAGRSLAGIPTALIDSILFGTIIYWFVGLAYNEGASIVNFFIYLLLVFTASLATGLIFSIFSAVVADKSTGQAAMAIALVLFVLFSGFTVSPDVIPDYWIWAYWINLFAWILRSLVVNEYQSGKYENEVAPGVTQGDSILTQFGFTLNGEPFEFVWVWYGMAFAAGVSIISVFASVFLLRRLRFDTGKTLAVEMPEDGDFEEEAVEEVALPFQKVNLTFTNVHYTVKASTSDEKLELLKGIDGYLEAGRMTALMGSSGAGKTTLMDVLSLRKTTGEIEGEVRLNGHLQDPLSFRRCTGYVEQFDVQSPQLTIRETVEFSAALRLESSDPAVTPESREKFVIQTLAMLELTEIQDLQVGSDLTGGLSFEQNKRLSIAVELVSNPSILFLDEPTSGLDARAASIVMRGLRRITDGGRAVCATIHQPSIAIFNGFDSLLLLKRGGETVFFGDLGDESVNLINYLERYPATMKILPGENPATWMLTTIGAGSSSSSNKPFDYAGSFAASKLRQQALAKINEFDAAATDENLVTFPTKYATSKRTQGITVLKRAMKIYWRSPSYNMVRMIVSVVVALLFGSVYASQRTPSTEGDMNSRVTTIFITFLFLAVNAFNTVLSVFEMERNMFYRHNAALMYNQKAVLVAFTLAEIPFIFWSSVLFVVPFYFLLGFEATAYKFFLYLLFFTMNTGLFTYLGQMMVSVTKNADAAQGFGGLFVGLTALFAGLLIRPQNINVFWVFAYWLFPGHYVLEGMVASQFHNDNTAITPSLGTDFCTFVLNSDTCNQQDDCTQCTGTAEEWVEVSFGGFFQYGNVWYDFLYLLAAIILSKVVTCWALTKLNYLEK